MEIALRAAYKSRTSAKGTITRVKTFLLANKDLILNKFEYINRKITLNAAYEKLCKAPYTIDDLETDPAKKVTSLILKISILL